MKVRYTPNAVELGVVVGQKGRDIAASNAKDYIGGYGTCTS